jgi:hypothetical protein
MADKYAVLIKYKYLEYIESANLSNDDAWAFMKSIIAYDRTGVIPEYENPILTGLFAVVKIDLDKNRENYEAVSEVRSNAGKEGAKKRWKGKNSKNGKCHDDMPKMANDSNCQENEKNMAKMHDLDLDSEFDSDSDINSSGSAESGGNKTPSPKPKKLPLREREPVNDMERVEKAYLTNWDALYSQGKVKTAEPIIRWGQIRKQLKDHFVKLKPEQIIQAINNGLKDERIMNDGYSLSTILTAWVLNRLINATQKESSISRHQKEKMSLE